MRRRIEVAAAPVNRRAPEVSPAFSVKLIKSCGHAYAFEFPVGMAERVSAKFTAIPPADFLAALGDDLH